MITSKNQTLSDNQKITADARSQNVIDLGQTGTVYGADAALDRDIGKGCPVPILIQVTEDFNNLTRLDVSLQVDSVENFASPKTVVSSSINLADLKAGRKVSFQYLPEGVDERYLSVHYDVVGTAPSTGKIWAGIVAGHQTA